jgi:hypothetical protein
MSNRFDFLKQVRERSDNGESEATPEPTPEHVEENASPPSPAAAERPERKRKTESTPPVQAVVKKRGRPNGKRSDEGYVQVTAYIQRETHFAVKLSLLNEKKGREFSELVEELLSKWIKARS